MKISKFVSVIKNTGQCIVIHMQNEIYLSTGASIYKASEFPEITGSAQIAAVLDIEPKKLKKIVIEEVHSKSRENICGFDMGCTAGEMEVTRLDTVAVVDGNPYTALKSENGEMIFFDEELLAPLQDRIKNCDDYLYFAVRANGKGERYIVIKDGFEVLGVILPAKVLSEKYIYNLRNFLSMCVSQFEIEKNAWKPGEEDNTEDNG